MSTTTSTQTQRTFAVTDDIPIPRGPVETELTFFEDPADGAVPYNYVGHCPEGEPQHNYGAFTTNVTINDIRGREKDFDMNVQGFTSLAGIKSDISDFDVDEEQIKKVYYPEIEKLLLDQVEGAHRIFIFDHTIRGPGADAFRGPVKRAHIDQTSEAARARVHHHMGEEAEELLKGRVRLINVWRPLNGPIVSSPLAYADSTSVPDKDVVPVEHRYPDRTGYTAGVRYSDQGKWYYLSGMTNDERILLQCYDSENGARTPHSAFADPRTQQDWPGRESIEVRTLVFG